MPHDGLPISPATAPAPGPRPGTARTIAPLAVAVLAAFAGAQTAGPEIPRTWDEQRLATLELPNAATGKPARHVDAAFYYSVPPAVIYRTYPVYHPDHEPAGYLEDLLQREPEIVFDADRLHSPQDWIDAGRHVFDWPTQLREMTAEDRAGLREQLAANAPVVTADGILPFVVYTIREKGKLESGRQSCAMCHTRVMPDGQVIRGAQGSIPFDRGFADSLLEQPPSAVRASATVLYGMPAVDGTAPPFPEDVDAETMAAALRAIPPGVLARHGTSAFSPVQVPDLIGIRDRKYLDRTGLMRHRDAGDLMRYAALNMDFDFLSEWDGFVPQLAGLEQLPADALPPGAPSKEELLAQAREPSSHFRYSDAQLYALTQYLYSLQPPPNPNPFDELARRGQQIFEQEDCTKCHPAPLYTSNQLTPVDGFEVPAALQQSEDIRSRGVGTDPTLALTTRRGTGFYKVPSLKGVWYRGPFSHDGSVATLEDWFDPRRLDDDYVPTGWNPGGGQRAVPGHDFGLDLTEDGRRALIAFLRTL